MKIENCINDDFVAILASGTSYVDNEYYRKTAGEDIENLSYKNYPVNVQGISIDWIINMDEGNEYGKKFLQAIFNSESLDIFECKSISALIEFLYIKYKTKILRNRLPFYVLQLFVFYTAISVNEKLYESLKDPGV